MTKKIEIENTADVVIIGAGAAGLFSALSLAQMGRRVTVLSEAELTGICASCWAQGGIAAAVSKRDSAAAHTQDTLKAAAGTADIKVVERMTETAPDYIQVLERYGVKFKKDAVTGGFALSREACHSERRVLRAKAGDGFGKELMRALTAATAQEALINFIPFHTALSVVREHTQSLGNITGILAHNHKDNSFHIYPAASVIMATGGAGGLFSHTTNPTFATGRGVAMAARAGAVLADMEFVQFHPTALDIGQDPAPLATEALRGEGAILVTEDGKRFMHNYHKMAELAPRDVVSRAVFSEISKGRDVFLDCRALDVDEFPALLEACESVNIHPATDLVPIHPAAHYHMGGIATDLNGRSSINGLWACGEVASTGLHGANRLASNSLMEAIVMAGHAAADIHSYLKTAHAAEIYNIPTHCQNTVSRYMRLDPRDHIAEKARATLRKTMMDHVGLLRNERGLRHALSVLQTLEAYPAIADMALVARIATASALQREESRGGHWRTDFPDENKVWQHRSFTTLKEVNLLTGTLKAKPEKKEKAYA